MTERPHDALVALPSQTVGPFFHYALTTNSKLGTLANEDVRGERIRLTLRLLDGEGTPVADGIFELWQADAQGAYRAGPGFSGFGRLETDAHGISVFKTVRPGKVDAVQSPHINVTIFSRGLLHHLFTRIYFEDDPSLSADPALLLVPAERRSTLIAHRDGDGWAHDLRLQGENETAFFDL